MANYYFIGPNGQSQTAVRPEELLLNGVTKDTFVWCEGMTDWAKAGDVAELKQLFQEPTAPVSNSVTIYGYTEPFAVNPAVKILKDGVEIAEVSRKGTVVIPISEPCMLDFKMSFRTTKCYVNPGDNVILSANRTTGGIEATVTTKENVTAEISNKKGKDQTRLVVTLIICAILLFLSMLF